MSASLSLLLADLLAADEEYDAAEREWDLLGPDGLGERDTRSANCPEFERYMAASHRRHEAMEAAALRAANARGDGDGECVAFRFKDTTFADPWSQWLPISELHHYGHDGNLVQGPHPDWEVERAYTPTPGSEVQS